ncbi:MAG: phage terminase large subunit, partial [Candidatus Omnitrophica bacterium]|nr:phage terminase large subunit [Candidatus Omnitrophota bacterium]
GGFGPDTAKRFFEVNKEEMLKGIKLLWPEHRSYYDLMLIREQEGPISFDSELQNEPFNDRNCPFNINNIRFWDDEYKTEEELIRRRGGHLLIYGACDPSVSNRESSDFSAIVTVAVDDITRIIYVLDVDVARRTPERTMNTILEYSKIRQYTRFGFESNQFQSLMLEELMKRAEETKCDLPLRAIKNTYNKQLRIEWLQPMIMSGRIQLSRRNRALIEEMKYYPKGSHDDALDALEMASRLAIDNTCFPQFLYRM